MVHLRPRCTSIVLGLLTLASCEAGRDRGRLRPPAPQLVTVPAEGSSTTLDLATWNVDWFGSTSSGPSDETLQLENVRDVIHGADIDIWGLQEVVGTEHWENLESQLSGSGYTGFLANESHVTDGPAYYSDYDGTEQKVGILYKSDLATLLGARIILTENNYDFAGRPPLEVRLRVSLSGATQDIAVIVLHAKAGTGFDDWERRQNGSIALKSYLDANYPTQTVFVIGDFNDDVDTSIARSKPSPYQNFVDDVADYAFPTEALSDAEVSSTVRYSDVVDHHLTTNEGNAALIAAETKVFRVDEYIADYGNTTSDHYPVLASYTFGSGGTTNSPPSASFTSVDVYRDGAKITTTANDGAHTDAIGARGGGSNTYQLCEAGTTTCSDQATVTF